MTWIYLDQPLEEVPTEAIGFVYRITNIKTGKLYIGKKNFFAAHTTQKTVLIKSTGLKKVKKIKGKKESDWKKYYGSSEEVKKDVELLGEANFKREILRMCYCKGELSYYEAKYQFVEDVLLNPNQYYNSWISCRIQRSHLKNLLDNSAKT